MPRVAQQDDVDIIELDSSPDLRPQTRATTSRQVNRTGKGKKRARPIPATDIIELSDSDLDGDAVSLPRSRGRRPQPPPAPAGPVAGPSRVAQMPLFLPDLDDAVEVDRPKSPSAKSTNSGVSSDMRRGMARLHLDQAPPPVVAPAQPVARPPEPPAAPVIVGPNAMGVDLTVDDGPARLDAYVAQVLEIVPDVLPEHVRMLVEQNEPTYEGQVVERILHSLFELPNYPKADPQGKGKRKREDDDQGREAKNVKVDYASKNRQPPGPMYAIQALERLYTDFPTIPVAHVRATFHSHNSLYAPTYLRLHDEVNSPNPPFRLKSSAVKRQPKGKMKPQEELEEEVAFIKNKFAADPSSAAAPEATSSAAAASVEVDPEDGGIECGCCFSSYAFDTMIQCPDAHLFCKDCMSSYAEGLLGAHDANIVCMDQTGCKLLFPASELRRFLTPKLLALYERVKQRKEIEAAGLEGLEECPHCDYKVVIENEQERLFRCQNEECMAVTCRQCKKPDHLPKSCKEVEDDKKLDGRHAIEEAMTKALMRNCPKCQKAFIKEHGCNKMICPNCRTMSCYVCRKVILGYEHFNNPPPYNGRKDPNKCELWDSVEKRHSDEVYENSRLHHVLRS
ncbi:uncharacterized protein C8Q71DRAFT_753273 [Rhodofomes roseus]|uniref:RING-type domain-containing protein n=1 Tax=Rhodofomes roseus TaxID=34475 RepID=A0ABQ8KHV9_9APHY|nr:uncharacterized protein C8Q71DRAFT_753273 [Rhodofomes roseus]KAH9837572.1 hypothetical protein C8Q71DRAFT_753273 [Rhodofomes roseus]